MSVWDSVVGQSVVPLLQRAVADADAITQGAAAGPAMSHAWLVTGPPGSGRSVVARAFAAALQCPRQGCGECHDCVTALAGSHPDVDWVATEGLSIGIESIREAVQRAARRPARGRWQVVVVEDADRLSDVAAPGLLVSIEEPPPRTVWVLCAPTAEDVVDTIRSRCRAVALRTPPARDVARHLETSAGIDAGMATFAARASQGHIGRARALAIDESVRLRRAEVLALPTRLDSVADALAAAATVVAAAEEDADARCTALDSRERERLATALGVGTRGAQPRSAGAALKELEKDQALRRKRVQRDSIDRALIDLLALYRDVLALHLGADPDQTALVNAERRPDLDRLVRDSTAEATLRRMEAILAAREALDANVAPLLAIESMMLTVRAG